MDNVVKDIIGMAVVGVLLTVAIPFVFMAACVWQLLDVFDYDWR